MIYARPTEYAFRGLQHELAGRSASGMVLLDHLVAGTDLPRDFMAKVFQQLVRAPHSPLVQRSRRRFLPSVVRRTEITLMQVVEAMEGPFTLDKCVIGFEKCTDQTPCAPA